MRFPKHKKIVSRRPDDDLFVRFIAYCGVYLRLQVAYSCWRWESVQSVMQWCGQYITLDSHVVRYWLRDSRLPRCDWLLPSQLNAAHNSVSALLQQPHLMTSSQPVRDVMLLGSTQTDIPRSNLSKLIFITASEQKRWKMFMELWMIIIERTNKQSVNCCRFLDWPYAALDRRLPR